MRLARLRQQMLIAMGLPACWVQHAPAPAAPPPDHEVAARPTTYVTVPSGWSEGRFAGARCARDTLPETICGRSEPQPGPDACGPTGQALESFGTQRVYVTRIDGVAHGPELSPFQHDVDATVTYQRTVSGPAEAVPRYCCYSRCSPMGSHHARPLRDEPGFTVRQRCVPAPPGGTRVPHAKAAACPAGIRIAGAAMPFVQKRGDQCCYGALVEERFEPKYIRGRAARVDGVPVVAPIAPHTAWSAARSLPRRNAAPRDARVLPVVDDLTPAVRARVAEAWLRAAQLEHASIASFSALSLRLLTLGAPPALVAAAHQAALDEIRHAQVAFELASAYAGRSLGPAPFAAAARLSAAGGLRELAFETFVDGCIAETAAAVEAERAAELAEDPAVAAALREIAADEARHAELAWAIVAWCVRTEGPALLATLRAELDRHLAARSEPDGRDDDLEPHGVLGAHALAAVRADTLAEVVAPCLAAL